MVQIGEVLVSLDLFSEYFCCDLESCHGACCIEGDAGAPVSIDEVAQLEDLLPTIWERLTPAAQAVIDKQGVVYSDQTGDLVTSIVNDKDCAFSSTCKDGICRCVIEEAFIKGGCRFRKPISCYLYPVRISKIGDYEAVNYHRWDICRVAVAKGKAEGIKLYRFLKEPLIRKFGEAWYSELELVADELKRQHYI